MHLLRVPTVERAHSKPRDQIDVDDLTTFFVTYIPAHSGSAQVDKMIEGKRRKCMVTKAGL